METKKILVVENERLVAKNLQNCLKSFGYEVPAIASSGQEAIQKAAEISPDLVLIDVRLRGNIDGIEAARQIYTRFNIPVIYLTGYADTNTLEQANTTVPFGYILKPFEEKELQTAIEIALYKHRMESNLKENQQVWVFWDRTERQWLAEQFCHNTLHDVLTDLPSRALFLDRLGCAFERAKRHKNYLFALLLLDIDHFRLINESLGQPIGDQLLIAIAERLKMCVRASDTVARLGEDEFVILLHDIPDLSDACRTADRIEQELMLPFNLDGHQVFTTASIGITLSSDHYERPEDLLGDADLALYRAKAEGRACYQVFDTTMYTQVVALLQLENDLRRAIERQEFRVYYQPIISLTTGKIIGFEALLRWQRGIEGGLVPPAKFIAVAEETGLIVPINLWVLREACRQMRLWQDQFPGNPPLTISVNFSSRQFVQANVVEDIKQILQETNLDASSLRIEITESVIIQNPESATTILLQLKALGIQLSIDDFGTGYSSLSHLHRFPIDTMKIDRSFISSLGDEGENVEIVQAILTLAHNLGIEVIAEGVETAEQVEQLRMLNCAAGQGYFFSMPLAPFQVGSLMAAELQW